MSHLNVSDTRKNKDMKSIKMAYQPSGKWQSKSLFWMVILALVGTVVSGIAGFGMSVLANSTFLGDIIPLLGILWWYILTPLSMVFITNLFIDMGIKKGKCRNPKVALIIGIFAALLSIVNMFGFAKLFMNANWEPNYGVEISHIIRSIVVIALTAWAARGPTQEPYCEKCSNWMKNDVPLTTSVDLSDKIVSSIKDNTFMDNINNFPKAFDKKNNCKVERWLCHNCGNGFINVTKKVDNNEQLVLSLHIKEN